MLCLSLLQQPDAFMQNVNCYHSNGLLLLIFFYLAVWNKTMLKLHLLYSLHFLNVAKNMPLCKTMELACTAYPSHDHYRYPLE